MRCAIHLGACVFPLLALLPNSMPLGQRGLGCRSFILFATLEAPIDHEAFVP